MTATLLNQPTASTFNTLFWQDQTVQLLDQTQLPHRCVYQSIATVDGMIHAIQAMIVRGAPAIGIAGAFGLVLAAQTLEQNAEPVNNKTLSRLNQEAQRLASARPTAVNLQWGIARMMGAAQTLFETETSLNTIVTLLLHEAQAILEEDLAMCYAIGHHGATLVPKGAGILTHCNAGGLATAGYGTALGVIRSAFACDKTIQVFADETRPRLQGAQLTTWELLQDHIPVTLLTDNMAAWLMKQGKVQLVVVGADRIAANGDSANKIGTYGLAVLAHAHQIPFYVAAPSSTIDFTITDGVNIPIEERAPEEVQQIQNQLVTPQDPQLKIYNPAFDVTPAHLITAIITERGIHQPPFVETLTS